MPPSDYASSAQKMRRGVDRRFRVCELDPRDRRQAQPAAMAARPGEGRPGWRCACCEVPPARVTIAPSASASSASAQPQDVLPLVAIFQPIAAGRHAQPRARRPPASSTASSSAPRPTTGRAPRCGASPKSRSASAFTRGTSAICRATPDAERRLLDCPDAIVARLPTAAGAAPGRRAAALRRSRGQAGAPAGLGLRARTARVWTICACERRRPRWRSTPSPAPPSWRATTRGRSRRPSTSSPRVSACSRPSARPCAPSPPTGCCRERRGGRRRRRRRLRRRARRARRRAGGRAEAAERTRRNAHDFGGGGRRRLPRRWRLSHWRTPRCG